MVPKLADDRSEKGTPADNREAARPWRLVAPVASAAEAREAIAAGADELYCGALLQGWERSFGDDELLTRRQGRAAHLGNASELQQVAQLARDAGRPVALTLNGRYTARQMAQVRELASLWEAAGGTAVVVADPGLLRQLVRSGSRLACHLSLLAGVFNPEAARLFADLGATRLVLPRDLSLAELEALARAGPRVEYEALALYQRCELIDGLCHFRHAVHLPAGVPCLFDYQDLGGTAVTWSLDPDYQGHGCALAFRTAGGLVQHLEQDDWARPHCAACQLPRLAAAGIGFFKLAGRGAPGEWVTRGIRFLRRAGEVLGAAAGGAAVTELPPLYARTFGRACRGERCYYAEGGA